MKSLAMALALLLLGAAPQRSRPPESAAGEPERVLTAEKAWAGGDVLWPLAMSSDPRVRRSAFRAIGRLEDPRNVTRLLALGQQPGVPPTAAADAIARSLNGFDPARDPELLATVAAWLSRVSFSDGPGLTNVMPWPIGHIKYATAAQVHAAEHVLARIIEWAATDTTRAGSYLGAVRSLESLGRLNATITTFEGDTVSRLEVIVAHTGTNDGDSAREAALAALIASRALDPATRLLALRDADWQVRRLATAALAADGAGRDEGRSLDLIREKISDSNGQVRYEAARGYFRRAAKTRGCGSAVSLLDDHDSHVVLAVLDGLGDACKEDEGITARLAAEARPPRGEAWHRPAHALVALAKRDPQRTALVMDAFASHPSWWVRMYAARAADAAGDVAHLERLAYDTSDNVRDAALAPLRRLKAADADPAIIASLDRRDVQLLRTAAMLLKDSSRHERFARPLLGALQRLTLEGKETSRDARVPLLEAFAIHAGRDDGRELRPLLKDFDAVVAGKAATVITQLTGEPARAEPVARSRGWAAPFVDPRQCATVRLASGLSFRLRMEPEAAPVTVDRFLELALVDHYYDGLAIHRVAPNFVIQGGGPGANEYSGQKEYMRDEIAASNDRGTVGLSTRGRNTADGQFYINLVDNPRLDADYTVFASVFPADMAVVDAIEEGEVMRTISPVACSLR